ncbi:hypothetical protein DSO57_1022352 [Entomophthora muscae]|uniref:Uncharacterized protein n=1 Tax=Entomophthora muscae TaxID=34485 RepID=A0ACC2SSN0_9FUNG|nr:hypothetical protein DSO57_1022352 [Entomophthora muscae]
MKYLPFNIAIRLVHVVRYVKGRLIKCPLQVWKLGCSIPTVQEPQHEPEEHQSSPVQHCQTPTPQRAGMSPEELQRHYREGLCFHCHEAGHLTRAYPKKNFTPIYLDQIKAFSQSYKFFLVSVNVNGTLQLLKTFIDTGVDESFIDAELAQELGLNTSGNCLQIILGNSTYDKGNNAYPPSFILLKGFLHPLILGDSWSDRQDFILNYLEQTVTLGDKGNLDTVPFCTKPEELTQGLMIIQIEPSVAALPAPLAK